LRVALAAYIRALTALDSRFDRAIRGDTVSITPAERRGFNLFVGKAKCGSCHFAPLFGGTLPPDFTRSELEIIGVPASRSSDHAAVDPDIGRAAVDHWAEHRFAFRVPTIRNAALTAPYMHNGVFATLEQVIEFYDRGGGAGLGEILQSQTLATRSLHLTARDKSDLVAFVRSLTDSSFAVANP
jgi:cytochrome c peroxidase